MKMYIRTTNRIVFLSLSFNLFPFLKQAVFKRYLLNNNIKKINFQQEAEVLFLKKSTTPIKNNAREIS